jgi:3-amino-4-hydroxybenzoic acid synthase
MNVGLVAQKTRRYRSVNGSNGVTLWYDTEHIGEDDDAEIFVRVLSLRYSGVVLYPHNFERLGAMVPDTMLRIVQIDGIGDLAAISRCPFFGSTLQSLVIASRNPTVLDRLQRARMPTCYRADVGDPLELRGLLEPARRYDYFTVRFEDPSTIPPELLHPSLQGTATIGTNGAAVEAAVVIETARALGAGLMISPRDHRSLDLLIGQLGDLVAEEVLLEIATVVESRPVGTGYRSCIDVATLLAPTEGMLVGSTLQGAFLCCPDVFGISDMDLRPFRVTAGAVHSYVHDAWNARFLTELRAGSPVALVNTQGHSRPACVGRIDAELRRLRLIEAEFESGERVNLITEDDWRVRIFSDGKMPTRITELEPGDRVLAHRAAAAPATRSGAPPCGGG